MQIGVVENEYNFLLDTKISEYLSLILLAPFSDIQHFYKRGSVDFDYVEY